LKSSARLRAGQYTDKWRLPALARAELIVRSRGSGCCNQNWAQIRPLAVTKARILQAMQRPAPTPPFSSSSTQQRGEMADGSITGKTQSSFDADDPHVEISLPSVRQTDSG